MTIINEQRFAYRSDFYVAPKGTLINTTIEPISTKLVLDFVKSETTGAVEAIERVNIKTKLDFYLKANYSFGIEITYSCAPSTALHGGFVDIEDIVRNMQDGIFEVEGLADVNPYNHNLGDYTWMDINCALVARAAELCHVGSIWSGSRDLEISFDDKDSYFALTMLTKLLNDSHGYEDSIFTPTMLSELRDRIKRATINQFTNADNQPLPSYQ